MSRARTDLQCLPAEQRSILALPNTRTRIPRRAANLPTLIFDCSSASVQSNHGCPAQAARRDCSAWVRSLETSWQGVCSRETQSSPLLDVLTGREWRALYVTDTCRSHSLKRQDDVERSNRRCSLTHVAARSCRCAPRTSCKPTWHALEGVITIPAVGKRDCQRSVLRVRAVVNCHLLLTCMHDCFRHACTITSMPTCRFRQRLGCPHRARITLFSPVSDRQLLSLVHG